MPNYSQLASNVLRDWIDLQDLELLRWSLTPSERRPRETIENELRQAGYAYIWLYAAEKGTPEVLELLAPWVDTAQHSDRDESPLLVALAAGNVATTRDLLERWGGHEHLFEVDSNGQDLVQLSIVHDDPALIGVLLDHLDNSQQSERAFNIALSQRKWSLADALAVRPEIPEHRIDAAVRRTLLEDHWFPLWTVRQEAQRLRKALDDGNSTDRSSEPDVRQDRVRSRL